MSILLSDDKDVSAALDMKRGVSHLHCLFDRGTSGEIFVFHMSILLSDDKDVSAALDMKRYIIHLHCLFDRGTSGEIFVSQMSILLSNDHFNHSTLLRYTSHRSIKLLAKTSWS